MYVDGKYQKTINTYSKTTKHRVIVFDTWLSAGPHTIKVVNKATPGHPRIDIDAVLTHDTYTTSGPESELYLNASNQRTISVVQDGETVRSWSTLIPSPSAAFGIAVGDTVRTASSFGGVEYTLDGTPTGVLFPGWTLPPSMADGTTDGNFNYSVDFGAGGVYRHELDWSDPTLLFTAGGTRIGITYDPSNKSFWVAEWDEQEAESTIENFSPDGTLLGAFTVPVEAVMALAMDYADGTLWFGTQSDLDAPVRILYQYSRTGLLLNTSAYNGLTNLNYLGGEFAFPGGPGDS